MRHQFCILLKQQIINHWWLFHFLVSYRVRKGGKFLCRLHNIMFVQNWYITGRCWQLILHIRSKLTRWRHIRYLPHISQSHSRYKPHLSIPIMYVLNYCCDISSVVLYCWTDITGIKSTHLKKNNQPLLKTTTNAAHEIFLAVPIFKNWKRPWA